MNRRTSIFVISLVLILIVGGTTLGIYRSQPTVESSVPVRVGYFQSHTGSSPILLGESQGFFAENDVTVEKMVLASSNQAMDALIRGDVDVSLLSLIQVLNADAVDSGNVQIFAVSALTNEEPFDSVVVKNESGIASIQDLAGKKISVFPGTTATAFLKQYLMDNGVDISQTEFIQMPPADHLVALESGAVQASYVYEPMLSIALVSGGVHAITQSVYATMSDRSPIGVYVVSTKFLTEHPELAERAVSALEEAMAYSNEHATEAAAALAAEFKLSADVASRVSLIEFVPVSEVAESSLTSFLDLLISFGEIKGQPDLDALLYR